MPKVGLDLGHGRNTFPPSKGVYKDGVAYHEHTFNASVGVALEKLLISHGIQVVKAQEPFALDVPLRTRSNFYDNNKVDIVWSIHANAGNKEADGVGVFYWYKSPLGKKLANLYLEESKKVGFEIWGSGVFASTNIPADHWTNFHMLRETEAPAVLTENGFMTNAKDFQLLFKDPGYIKKTAEVHAKAICRYFGITYKGTSPTVKPIAKPIEKPVEKEEIELYEKAIVIYSETDYPSVKKLHIRSGFPIFERGAVKKKIAKEILVAGGGVKGLEKFADKVTDLSGPTWLETAQKVDAYMKKL